MLRECPRERKRGGVPGALVRPPDAQRQSRGVPQGETAEAYLVRTYGGDKRHMRALGYRDRDWVHPKAFLESERPRIKGLVARSRSLGMS